VKQARNFYETLGVKPSAPAKDACLQIELCCPFGFNMVQSLLIDMPNILPTEMTKDIRNAYRQIALRIHPDKARHISTFEWWQWWLGFCGLSFRDLLVRINMNKS
jgi:hypothetical protein